jgi:hypothetical protein
MRGGAVAVALIICGDPCRIRMDYVVCPSQDVDCDCWDRPAGESKMRCDVVMHASYFSMHSAPKQDVDDLMVRNEGRRRPSAMLFCVGWAVHVFEIIEFPREIIVEFGIAREVAQGNSMETMPACPRNFVSHR